MTDETTSTNDDGSNAEGGEGSEGGSGLRKQLEQVIEENKQLKAERRSRVYDEAGIPEGARDLFDSAYTGELTVDALREFGESKGFKLLGLDDGGEGQPNPAQQRAEGEQRLEQVQGGTLPVRDPSPDDEIAQAEANGDWDTYDRLQAQKLDKVRRAS